MTVKSMLTILLIALCAKSAQAQVPWDMVQTAPVAPELNETQFQSPVNQASLNGYSLASPQSQFQSGNGSVNSGAATGTAGNTTYATNSIGVNPTQIYNNTLRQTQGLNLPTAGTMGLAPVFGTTNDGFTSPGGFVPPTINIPGVGSFRIPSSVGIPGVGSIQLPNGYTVPSL